MNNQELTLSHAKNIKLIIFISSSSVTEKKKKVLVGAKQVYSSLMSFVHL